MGSHPIRIALLALVTVTALSACDRANNGKRPGETSAQLAKSDRVRQEVGGIEGATPMDQRVAVVGLLNKRNGLVRDLEMKPGDTVRAGQPLFTLSADDGARFARALDALSGAWEIGDEAPASTPLVLERITA